MLLMLSGTASAQLTNYSTVVTFDRPIEVPGSTPQVLPAGTYMFKVVDSKVNRNIVQISNKDDTHVYTTILAIPTHRDEESDKTVMMFDERPAGQPPALRAWYYPFEKSGQEFVYPKEKAAELARASNSTVPFSDSSVEVPAVAGSSRPINVSTAPPTPIMAVTAGGATVQPAYPQNNNAAAPASSSQGNNSAGSNSNSNSSSSSSGQSNNANASRGQSTVQTASLPRTGSEMPLLALIGSCSLFAGLSIKVIAALCAR